MVGIHFYRNDEYLEDSGLMHSDHIVADIHTTPTDCCGNMHRWISLVGTAPVNFGIFVTLWVDGELTAFAGPVMSYYEDRTENFLRLTDDEWDNSYLQSATRPDWVNIYLADTTGNSRGSGSTLLTSVESSGNPTPVYNYEIKISNYPNPFNLSRLISFTVPSKLTNQNVQLAVYDISGQLITELVNQNLPSGNYIYRWEATNSVGDNLTSGVYFYRISIADKTKSGKMILLI